MEGKKTIGTQYRMRKLGYNHSINYFSVFKNDVEQSWQNVSMNRPSEGYPRAVL